MRPPIAEPNQRRSLLSWDRIAVLYTLCAALCFWLLRSTGLDDFDSINFALGIQQFDITRSQPHPPGFPVYIAIGHLLNRLLKDPCHSLTLLSALSGGLGLYLLYVLLKRLSGKRIALLTVFFSSLVPLYCLLSQKALSDMPAMAMTLLTGVCMLRYGEHGRRAEWWMGMLAASAAIGIRLHVVPIVLAMMVPAAIARRDRILPALASLPALCLLWLAPMVWLSGWEAYLEAAQKMVLWRMDKPDVSILAGGNGLGYHFERLRAFGYFFAYCGLGIDWHQPVGKLAFIGLAFPAIWGLCRLGSAWMKIRRQSSFTSPMSSALPPPMETPLILWRISLLVGVAIYGLAIYIYLPPSNTRYLIYFVPLWALGTALFVDALPGRLVKGVAVIFGGTVLALHSLPLIWDLHTQKPPPIQLIMALQHLVGPNQVVYTGPGIARFQNIYPANRRILPAATPCNPERLSPMQAHSIYYLATGADCGDACRSPNCTVIEVFKRDPRIHWKHNTVRLIAFIPSTVTSPPTGRNH